MINLIEMTASLLMHDNSTRVVAAPEEMRLLRQQAVIVQRDY